MTSKRVLILGANGFIGNALVRELLDRGHTVVGMDLESDKLDHCLGAEGFRFVQGDIAVDRDWVEQEILAADVVLPLVAIATPALYVREPLRVFELDFEENMRVIRLCVEHGKRLIFPSTSEVYGMCQDNDFDEETSALVMGPIHKQRWIYGCLKQLLDRVIYAYGVHEDLDYTLFRPFNWIGPRLDAIDAEKIGSSRVVTQFIGALVRRQPIDLVDGGAQRRCYTYISDGVDALVRMIEDESGASRQQIFNIGNPENECSVGQLAERLHRIYRTEFGGDPLPLDRALRVVDSRTFYGEGYQDLTSRRPSIAKAQRELGWMPRVDLECSLRETLRFFLGEMKSLESRVRDVLREGSPSSPAAASGRTLRDDALRN
ncbi:MAG: bifunctional UDP-4-keto-pentose/UDP-xylose synthase [Planctomycetes bacterium]|nr:bifunctional UDP-4-keto-pentose/UDP-xylose synthase [Planctomycetota bacterium]